jgi:hypothetical protein
MSIAKPTGIFAFKWLRADGVTHGGNRPYRYDLPIGDVPSIWHSNLSRRPIKLCENGFHCIGVEQVLNFDGYGPRLFLVEIAGRFDSSDEKVAVEHIRLIRELKYKYNSQGSLVIPVDSNGIPLNYLKKTILGHGRLGTDCVGVV